MSAARLSALSVVVFAGPVTLGELAAAEHVRPPTMTRIVSGLEADGLIRRAGDPADARVTRVRATAKGRRVMQAGRRRRVVDLTSKLRALGGAEVATLARAAEIMERISRSAG